MPNLDATRLAKEALQDIVFTLPASAKNSFSKHERLQTLLDAIFELDETKQLQEASFSKDRFKTKSHLFYDKDHSHPNAGLEIKFFHPDSDNGARTQYYKDQVQSIVAGARHTILATETEKLAQLQKLSDAFIKKIMSAWDIDTQFTRLDLNGTKTGDTEREAYLKKTDAQFLEFLQSDVIPRLSTLIAKDNEPFSDAQKRLRQGQIDAQSTRGRKSFLNVFEVPTDVKGQENTRHFSMEIPISLYTDEQLSKLTKNDDRRAYTNASYQRNTEGLANLVLLCSGHFDINGKPIVTQAVTRHASYPPIDIKDPQKRLGITVRNIQQHVMNSAMHQLADSINSDDLKDNSELTVSLSEICLLTVMPRWVPDVQAQYQQVYETYLAMNMCEGKPLKVTIPTIDGNTKTVSVKPKFSYMALGVNLGHYLLPGDPLQAEINTSSYNKFLENFDSYLSTLQKTLTSPQQKALIQAIKNTIYFPNNTTLQEDVLTKRIALQKSYDALYKKLPAHASNDELATIDYLRKQLQRREQKLLDGRIAIWNKCLFLIKVLLEASELTGSPKRQITDFITAQNLFFTGKYAKKAYNYDFQAVMQRIKAELGDCTAIFCNDGEDRTGHEGNCIIAAEIFKSQKGKYPDLGETTDRKHYRHGIQPFVYQFSTAQDNTKANSEAPGLEIHWWDGHDHIQLEEGKRSASRAKAAYEIPLLNRVKSFFSDCKKKLPVILLAFAALFFTFSAPTADATKKDDLTFNSSSRSSSEYSVTNINPNPTPPRREEPIVSSRIRAELDDTHHHSQKKNKKKSDTVSDPKYRDTFLKSHEETLTPKNQECRTATTSRSNNGKKTALTSEKWHIREITLRRQ